MKLFENLTDRKWNQFLKFSKLIWEQDGAQATHTEVNSVFPTSNRVFYDFLYPFPEKNAHIISSDDNHMIPEELRNEAVNCKGKIKGHVKLVGNKFVPIMENGQVVGTMVYHLNNVELGGTLPAWIVKKFGVSTLVQQVLTMSADARK